ncbi:hypothetical protein V5799_010152 [Amblyomma americanum]|uniref:Uncharacterized protein n=1 Tax=Amblyomma americanum TaxID=6943 RepID=A0AAQ4F9F7_AMBAM
MRLQEKIPEYAEQGVDVKVHSEGGAGSWAVLLVTPIMRRAQQLESSSEVIFVDSTASCDSTRSSVSEHQRLL